MCTVKNFLLDKSEDNKTDLLSLLEQSNIKKDSIEYNNQNSKSSFASSNNCNNAYQPLDTDNLSALYAYYHIDPHMYPPPDLQLYKITQQSVDPSYSYLQSSRMENSSFSERRRSTSNNSSRRSQGWRRKQKRLTSNRNRKTTNKLPEIHHFHHRNMINVRRVSCHDLHDSQMIMKKELKYEHINLKNQKINNYCECI
jgi:hypothetical protein